MFIRLNGNKTKHDSIMSTLCILFFISLRRLSVLRISCTCIKLNRLLFNMHSSMVVFKCPIFIPNFVFVRSFVRISEHHCNVFDKCQSCDNGMLRTSARPLFSACTIWVSKVTRHIRNGKDNRDDEIMKNFWLVF